MWPVMLDHFMKGRGSRSVTHRGRRRAAQSIEDAAVLATCLADDSQHTARALRRYESLRIGRTIRLQQASRDRARINHLPDGPEQRARDAALAGEDPLLANDWIYSYDPEAAAAEIAD
jgi:salicylate hydroxylase